jgi:hypothetical protein
VNEVHYSDLRQEGREVMWFLWDTVDSFSLSDCRGNNWVPAKKYTHVAL